MPDHIEELHELRESADILLQQTEAAYQQLGPVEAADETGQVTVRLASDGLLETIRVGITWDQDLDAEDLAPAVLEAVTQAQGRRLEQYGGAVARVESEPPPRARPVSPESAIASFHERTAGVPDEAEAAMAFLEEILAETDRGLGELADLLGSHESRTHRGRSGSGHVTAEVSGGGVLLQLEIDPRWVPTAHPANLGREMTDAVRRAVALSQTEGVAAVMSASRLADVARMTTGYQPPRPATRSHEEDTP